MYRTGRGHARLVRFQAGKVLQAEGERVAEELGCEVGDETLTISLPDGAEGLEPGADSLFPIVLNKAK